MSKSNNLRKAKAVKNDEFYTRLQDIEQELVHYKDHFKDKVIYLNCDDPLKSNFWRYFAINYANLQLKGLIATHYQANSKYVYNRDGSITKFPLFSDGDFRSNPCVEILKEADLIVTNPPFSLFREFIALMIEQNKKFLIIGNMNAYTYKEVFPLLKDNKIWTGYTRPKAFILPDGSEKDMGSFRRWFTNLDVDKRHGHINIKNNFYNDKDYPKYDNFNAIEVEKVNKIPCDYEGVMGMQQLR